MNEADARALFASARVARLATADERGRPHLVPIVFAPLADDRLVSAVDHKPKRTAALKRLANIAANPAVAVLVDQYADDWDDLWWARADGRARVLDAAGEEEALRAAALAALVERYPQYRERPPTDGAVIVVEVTRWSAWRARP